MAKTNKTEEHIVNLKWDKDGPYLETDMEGLPTDLVRTVLKEVHEEHVRITKPKLDELRAQVKFLSVACIVCSLVIIYMTLTIIGG